MAVAEAGGRGGEAGSCSSAGVTFQLCRTISGGLLCSILRVANNAVLHTLFKKVDLMPNIVTAIKNK